MTITLRGGFTTEDPRLDRVPEFDERSRDYPVTVLLTGDEPLRGKAWYCSARLDQGREGACVGFGWSHEAAAYPAHVPNVTNAVAREVYLRAQFLDQWPGEAYSGTSVLAGAKVAKERGWVLEYRWAFSEEDLARAIGYIGPAVIGIPWLEGMRRPDAKGYIHPTGAQVGGHAIMVRGFSAYLKRYRLTNSWGSSWGINGECFITRADMAYLLSLRGDACIPVTRAVPR